MERALLARDKHQVLECKVVCLSDECTVKLKRALNNLKINVQQNYTVKIRNTWKTSYPLPELSGIPWKQVQLKSHDLIIIPLLAVAGIQLYLYWNEFIMIICDDISLCIWIPECKKANKKKMLTFEILRNIFKLWNVIFIVATMLFKQRQDPVKFFTGMSWE